MRLRVIILYIVGVFLLIFGNRNLWMELQKQREEDKKERESQARIGRNLKKEFEIQELQYDSLRQQWINPHIYFQLVNVSYVDFSNKDKGKTTTIEKDDDENASDSQ